MMDLEYTHKTTYGTERFYPANENAIFLAKLMKLQTMSLEILKDMKAFGWNVKVNYNPFEL